MKKIAIIIASILIAGAAQAQTWTTQTSPGPTWGSSSTTVVGPGQLPAASSIQTSPGPTWGSSRSSVVGENGATYEVYTRPGAVPGGSNSTGIETGPAWK